MRVLLAWLFSACVTGWVLATIGAGASTWGIAITLFGFWLFLLLWAGFNHDRGRCACDQCRRAYQGD